MADPINREEGLFSNAPSFLGVAPSWRLRVSWISFNLRPYGVDSIQPRGSVRSRSSIIARGAISRPFGGSLDWFVLPDLDVLDLAMRGVGDLVTPYV